MKINFTETIRNARVNGIERRSAKEAEKRIKNDEKEYFKYLDNREKRDIALGMTFQEARAITNERKKDYIETSIKVYDL